MDVDWLQWPAMIVTIVATWLIASRSPRRRRVGFWCYLASNALWVWWGWYKTAYALVFMQFALAALNLRGISKNDAADSGKPIADCMVSETKGVLK